ncbi:KinB-signaling pathway activation protein [Psychrobacillus sp. NPDC058041]|uniref:KinB-signaling pathway activation protein n=1 Tax=Psychrobacillus sp. NPDC058041 TaxID=3346310 RepID=UPI0036DEE600
MTIRNWFKFFLNAMWIGGLITGVLGSIILWDKNFASYYAAGQWGAVIAAFIVLVGFGLIISVIAQMGFFAYLTIHQMGVNIFKSLTLWNWVQLLIIAFVIFDLIVFRFKPSEGTTSQIWLHIVALVLLIGASIIVAIIKANKTKKQILISALFFMIAITTIEWVAALKVQSSDADVWLLIVLVPLLAVNAYQLLALPKYNAKSDEDRKKLEARRKARKEAAALKTK